jgi:oxygen-independent coproporphyrinogen-3 oxidase
MGELAAERLPAAGFARYEISSWARPGRASSHNQRYWDGSPYLGVGAGAHSFHPGPPARRWSTLRQPQAYMEAVGAGRSAVADEHELDAAEARGDFVFTGIRRLAGVDGARFAQRFGLSIVVAFPHVPGLVRDGLLEWNDEALRLTPQGLRFADTVAATFV